jgi:hypothetical protein
MSSRQPKPWRGFEPMTFCYVLFKDEQIWTPGDRVSDGLFSNPKFQTG